MDPVLKSPVLSEDQAQPDSPENSIHQTAKQSTKQPPPLLAKLTAILLISCISFGSHWYSSVTSAMKSTLKKELHISNTQFSLLEASEDFMATVLLPFSGLITDRFGGANMIVYGNIIYTLGSILVATAATVESYKFMIGSRVILAFGDIATQIAQYKMFSSWFSPNNGFASTVGFELAIGKLGGFAGQSTANIIAKKTGHFYWTFWVAVFMNLFTNASTALFWIFSRYCEKRYIGRRDTATNEHLTEKNRNFELKKVFQLPWTFWAVLSFSLFQTSAAVVFSQNSTELAEKRFNVSSIKAGWYSALSQYTGFFLVPCLGVFIDILGNRATVMCVCGIGMLLCMCLVNFADTTAGTAASFGIYAVAVSFGPVSIIDSIRAVLYHQSVFGSAYSLKVTMNNAMNIIIRIITGALQDADNDSYRRAVRVYLFQAAASVVVGLTILIGSCFVDSLAVLQWTRKYRLKKGGDIINLLKEKSTTVHLIPAALSCSPLQKPGAESVSLVVNFEKPALEQRKIAHIVTIQSTTMSGIQRFLTKRGEKHRRPAKQEKEPPIPGVRSYLRGLVIKSETVPSNDTSDGQKVKALEQRLASTGILDLNSAQIQGALSSPYAQGDVEKAFDLLMVIEDSIEGILQDYNPDVKLVGAVNRQGVTCYLDALLFAMFARLDFFEAILYRPFTDNNDPRRRLVILLRLWVNMLRSGRLITTDITEHLQEALSECGWPEAAKLCQQDASEAFTFVTEKLELPLLTLKMDIYHTGKEDVADDHKFINERLLEVAIPPEHEDGTAITLEECLEAYFNNKIEVKRYLERRGTINSVRSFDSSTKAGTVHVETVEVGSSAPSPIGTSSPKIEYPLAEKFSASSMLSRRSSIVQERFVPDKGSHDDLVHPGRKRKGSYRKEVMMPAWQFFSLIPWYTDNTPMNDAQVAAHFSSKRPILGMCLKRYSVLPNGNAIRLNTFIDIPTEIGLPHFIQDDRLDENGPLYGNFKLSLQSVVCHRGNSVDSGHYISLVRGSNIKLPSTSYSADTNLTVENSDLWMRFDDLAADRVTRVNIEEALKEESPYLLFYQIVPIDDSFTEESFSDKRASFISGSEDLHDDQEKEILLSAVGLDSIGRDPSSARLSFDLSSLRPTLDNTETYTSSNVPDRTMTDIKDSAQNNTSLRDAFTARRSLSIPRRRKESQSRSRSRGGDQSGEKRLSAFSRFTSRMSKEKSIENPPTNADEHDGQADAEDGTVPSISYDETEIKEQERGRDATTNQNKGKQRRKQSTNKKERPDRECLVM